jgi:hypothetical protein
MRKDLQTLDEHGDGNWIESLDGVAEVSFAE